VFEAGQIIEQFRNLGLSGYEAKAYLALIGAGGPLNGYEVAKRSGIPRSTVYEVIGKLVTRGAAFEVRSSASTTSYVPLPPEALLRRLREEFDRSMEGLAAALPLVAQAPESPVAHHIEGRLQVLERANDLIAAATGELHVSAWAEDLEELTSALHEADRRSVEISALRFGASGLDSGRAAIGRGVYDHLFSKPEVVKDRVGCQLLLLAADRREVLIGATLGGTTWASYSDDPAVVLVTVEFIRHDIGFQVLAERIGVAEVDAMFASDPVLRRLERGHGAPGLRSRMATMATAAEKPE
jgi:HTH-type transcriptional regulator, sugar sensing transcriptional regulator